jgi:hypothetical protein
MTPGEGVDLGALHQAIIDAIAGQFPGLATVTDYPDKRAAVAMPACLIEIVDFEAEPDPGTGQLALLGRFSARLLIGFRTPDTEREIRRLAGAVAVFVHQQRWGHAISPAEVTSIAPDAFDVDLDKITVWAVEWQQVLNLGDPAWINDGTIPTDVLFSFDPDIGIPHEPDYRPIDGITV